MAKSTKPRRPSKPKRRLVKIVVDELSLVDRHCVPSASFIIAKRLTDEDPDMTASDQSVEHEAPATPEAAAPPEAPQETVLAKSNETVAQAFLDATNKLRKVAGQMNPSDLEILARMMSYTGFRFEDQPFVKEAELFKSLDPESIEALRKSMHTGKLDADAIRPQLVELPADPETLSAELIESIVTKSLEGVHARFAELQDEVLELKKSLAPADPESPPSASQEPGEKPAEGGSVVERAEAIVQERQAQETALAKQRRDNELANALASVMEGLGKVNGRFDKLEKGIATARGKVV